MIKYNDFAYRISLYVDPMPHKYDIQHAINNAFAKVFNKYVSGNHSKDFYSELIRAHFIKEIVLNISESTGSINLPENHWRFCQNPVFTLKRKTLDIAENKIVRSTVYDYGSFEDINMETEENGWVQNSVPIAILNNEFEYKICEKCFIPINVKFNCYCYPKKYLVENEENIDFPEQGLTEFMVYCIELFDPKKAKKMSVDLNL